MLVAYLRINYSRFSESKIPDLPGSLVNGVLKPGLPASCLPRLVATNHVLDPRSRNADSNYPGSRMLLVGRGPRSHTRVTLDLLSQNSNFKTYIIFSLESKVKIIFSLGKM